MPELDTNKMRESIPMDIKQHYWIRRLLECLAEVDRLVGNPHKEKCPCPDCVERRTQEACFEAGWEWMGQTVVSDFDCWPPEDKESFRKAICSAKGTS